MNSIEQKLHDLFGFDLSLLGTNAVGRAVRSQMHSLELHRIEDYKRLLEAFPAQWVDLADELVVVESWFHRDPCAFAALAKLVHEEWLPANPFKRLRLLSVPCASGEEPYSMAMTLLDAGIDAERFLIEGVDLSPQALLRSRQGVYSKHAFRGSDAGFRQRYFQRSGDNFILEPPIQRSVHFRQGNILQDDCLAGEAEYDFIFCRNLLIYMHSAAQTKLLRKLQQLLVPGGSLFLGPAEQSLALEHGFASAKIPMAFACRKPLFAGLSRQLPRPAYEALQPPSGQPPSRLTEALRRTEASKLTGAKLGIASDLECARRLADAGRLQEAAALCEAHLQQSRTSAQAYYLLGLVRDAIGDATARECYRKALYLEPKHYESLVHLAVLAQKSGDEASAQNLRRRADRLMDS